MTMELRNSSAFRIATIIGVVVIITETQWSYEFSRITVSFFAVALASLLALPALPRRAYLVSPIALFFVGLVIASTSWSDSPNSASQNSLFVVAALYCATLIGSTSSAREIAWGIALGQFAILLASVVVVLTDPAAALVGGPYENGALKGVFGHRNLFAFFMLLGLAASLTLIRESITSTLVKLSLAASFLVAIVMSSSATAILVAAINIAAVLVVLALRWIPAKRRGRIALGAGLGVLVLSVLVLVNIGTILEGLGRDRTLTYRTVIWDVVGKWVGQRPLLGYGWESAWDTTRTPGREITTELALKINHSHSIYVELWLVLGFVGVAAVAIGLLVALAYSTAGSVFGADGSSLLWLNLTLVLAVHGVSETMLVRPPGLLLFFLLLARSVNDGGFRTPVTRFLCLAITARGGRPPEIWRHAR